MLNPNLRKFLAAGTLGVAAILGLPGMVHAARPNIIIIQTDDQNGSTVRSQYRGDNGRNHLTMPNTVREIFNGGTEFSNYYATAPVCSPSRASLLTGQYPHTNKLFGNEGQRGGWEGFQAQSTYSENVPVSLSAAGYRTLHVGKFMNGYYDEVNDRVDTTVPPGWDRWFTTAFLPGTKYYGYEVSDNGTAAGPFGNPNYKSNGPGIDSKKCSTKRLLNPPAGITCNYLPDVMTRQAVKEIKRAAGSPFYLQVDYQAPHGDVKAPEGPQPATRHMGSASRTPLPRPKDFNEADISDKPVQIRKVAKNRLSRTDIKRLSKSYRLYLESLRSVDDGVGAIFDTLRKTGQLDNTYVFYLSDHGFFLGEHRFDFAKFMPYDASAKVAMAVRGPGVKKGKVSPEVTGNIDIGATTMALAGANPPYDPDGRSLKPYWKDSGLRSRRGVEISLQVRAKASGATTSAKAPVLNYDGLRVGPYKFIDYELGEDELYDLSRDPFELRNKIDKANYAAVQQYMEDNLPKVTDCRGAECRADLPPWPDRGD